MLSFRSLKNAAARRGYVAEQFVFDCGDTVRIYECEKLLLVETRHCGSPETASEAMSARMIAQGMLVLQDFDETIGAS